MKQIKGLLGGLIEFLEKFINTLSEWGKAASYAIHH